MNARPNHAASRPAERHSVRPRRIRRTNPMRTPPRAPRRRSATPIRLLTSLMGFAVFFGASLGRAAPPAGTHIDNSALAVGSDAGGGWLSQRSDTVEAIIQPWGSVTLTPGTLVSGAAGASVHLPHRLTNPGNLDSNVRIDVGNLGGDAFDLASLTLIEDLDRSGTLTPGDVALAPGAVITIAPGDSIDVLAGGIIPTATPPLALAMLQVTATELAGGTIVTATDTVRSLAGPPPPVMAFYTDGSYSATTITGAAGQPLYLEASAPACDLDPTRPDTISISLFSQRIGDSQTYAAIETAPSSGLFRIGPSIPTALLATGGGAVPAGVLAIARNDEIVATLAGCGSASTLAHVWIDPAGVVFDSRSDAPISGARVALIDVTGQGNGGQAGGAARVFQSDGVTPAPSSVLTDVSGSYVFPNVQASTYRLDVTPPSNYSFPSQLPIASLPPSHVLDATGSYGGDFSSPLAAEPVRLDVPLDVVPQSAIYVEKTAGTSLAEIGDLIDYSVRIEGRSDTSFTAVSVTDRLPVGFAYVAGSARRDQSRLADPAGSGPTLNFALGALGAHESVTLHYRARVAPGALDGDGVNHAYASAPGIVSNTASVRVELSGGVFADEATIVGTVYFDRDGNLRRDGGDPGVPGVRVVADDGTYAITDGDGRYSFYGLEPRTHALRVDRATLPAGSRFEATSHRDGGLGSRFVDLERGDLQRADFALSADSTLELEAVARATALAMHVDELTRVSRGDISWASDARPAGDPRSRPASGVLTGEEHLPLFGPGDGARADSVSAGRVLRAVTPIAVSPGGDEVFEHTLRHQTSEVGFLGLADGDTVPANRISVRVKGEPDLPLELWVNGDPVPANRVGRRVQLPDGELEGWEYVGLELKPGINRLEVAQRGNCGDEHGRATLTLVAPDALGGLTIHAMHGVPADGHSTCDVEVRALDRRGVPVTQRTYLTLESTLGDWRTADLDPDQPGVQVAIEGGEAHFALTAPTQPGLAVLHVASGSTEAETTLTFVPDLRSMIAVGMVEGIVSLHSLTRSPDATGPQLGFESSISQFSAGSADGQAQAAARAALFLKGRVREGLLLTLGYDSDRPAGQRPFRDIQPDAFYPIYGDGSVRGYEAQTTGRLYARLDRRDGSLLYGDFVAQTTGGEHSLSAYSRSLTGLAEHFEDSRMRIDAFASRDHSHQSLEELPAVGTSGPYQLATYPVVENSERIEIVTRDRDHTGVVIHSEPRTRFTDYEFDASSGRIVFKAPVPSMDADLNPVSIRVHYDVESGGDSYWVSGVEGRVHVRPSLELGGTYVDDLNPAQTNELRGVFAGLHFGPHSLLEGEYAATHVPGEPFGQGGRLEFNHADARLQLRAYTAVTDSAFSNPSAGFATGRIESSLRLTDRLDSRTQLRAEGLYTADRGGDEKRGGLLAVADRTLSDPLRAEMGFRFAGIERRDAAAPPNEFAARGKLTAQWPQHPELSGYAELEQNLADSRRLAALGGEFRFSTRGRLYARHELISSLHGPTALDASERRISSVLGVESDVNSNTHVFSEYRLEDALSGRDAQAAMGLRNGWELSPGVRLSTSFERLNPLLGSTEGPSTAATGAFDFTQDPMWKANSRVELRSSRASDGLLTSMAMAGRMNPTWTALGRTLIDFENLRSQGQRVRDRLQVGLAARAPGSGWDALGRYELHYDREPGAEGEFTRRLAHVLSLHGTGPSPFGTTSSFSWAGKLVHQEDDYLVTHSAAQWVHGRFTRDLSGPWDAGISASTLFGTGASHRDGFGLELGRSIRDGVWLSAGWNYFGYTDPDLPSEEYTQRGVFMRVRARLDEDLLGPNTRGDR